MAKLEKIRWAVLLVLATASGGCGPPPPAVDRSNALVVVTIDYQSVEPAPKSLLFSWLRCGTYLFDRLRVPASGPLTDDPASVYVKLTLAAPETRVVVVEAIASDRLVGRATGRLDVRPNRTSKIDLRMSPIDEPGMTAAPISGCGADASPPEMTAAAELPVVDSTIADLPSDALAE